jgi:serine/threonine protein kinase
MNSLKLVGETLDGKYKIERELGKGGMGTVYFAIHLGTERPVAIKVILPKFMQKPEFVERFRREARAAGRLRHPNVVDVTDFGFAETIDGKVAYLVMEYLDGCTLGEVLDEEKQLPLHWTLDILEQVSSAVNEAHKQGIIHRDLKPDNIWLEPNQRGGYTVKVLDFGIAKLEEGVTSENIIMAPTRFANPTKAFGQSETVADNTKAGTLISESKTAIINNEQGTLIQENYESDDPILEGSTAILSDKATQLIENEEGTQLLANTTDLEKSNTSSANLTRVGAVLGTPLYMSPEQCRGEKLDSRSDIYSLAVIAYQMLGGKTPFSGDFVSVMNSHKENEPPPLDAKKIPRKVKEVIRLALAKNIADRPETAEAFSSELRSHSDGFGKLLQRALVLYSEHLPKFLLLAFLVTLPHIFSSLLRVGFGVLGSLELIDVNVAKIIIAIISFVAFFVQIFAAAMIVGTVTWILAQILAAPLKPVSISAALHFAWQKKRSLFGTVTVSTLISFIGMACCILPGIYFSTIFMLVAPVIMMEGVSGRAAFRRSKELVKRSIWTAVAVAMLIYLVPATIGGVIGGSVVAISKQLESGNKIQNRETTTVSDKDSDDDFDINFGPAKIDLDEKGKDEMETKLPASTEENQNTKRERQLKSIQRETFTQGLMELILIPIMILITSLTSIITALMYFKTRQAGGESMQGLLRQFEDNDRPQSSWQHRIRKRIENSGKSLNNT